MGKHYRIEFRPRARKDLKSISKPLAARIVNSIEQLASNPTPIDSKLLKGSLQGLYRLRVGQYRVIYLLKAEEILILITRIGHRKDIYR